MELLQTEKNYVGILHTILNVRILNVCTCTVHAIHEQIIATILSTIRIICTCKLLYVVGF